MMFLAVVGPGFITANVDNDAGGIWTYSQAGAQFGYGLLWAMIPMTLALIVVQEMYRPHGRRHRQRAQRSHPRRVRLPHHVPSHGWPCCHQLRQCGCRVCRHRGQPRSLRNPHLGQCAVLCRTCLGDGRQGQLQVGREGLPRSIVHLSRLHRALASLPIPTGRPLEWRPSFRPTCVCSAAPATSTWSSESSAPPSLPGCSSICNPRWSRRESPRSSTATRAWMSS